MNIKKSCNEVICLAFPVTTTTTTTTTTRQMAKIADSAQKHCMTERKNLEKI
jgi:hypothetical protein